MKHQYEFEEKLGSSSTCTSELSRKVELDPAALKSADLKRTRVKAAAALPATTASTTDPTLAGANGRSKKRRMVTTRFIGARYAEYTKERDPSGTMMLFRVDITGKYVPKQASRSKNDANIRGVRNSATICLALEMMTQMSVRMMLVASRSRSAL
mmetsp:Transcript_159634/g.294403  ORF Transcript_159634/g.294403 Transcript_159634/m.294403 type:complete len:155 (+) Transcript_159634:209-673(+)